MDELRKDQMSSMNLMQLVTAEANESYRYRGERVQNLDFSHRVYDCQGEFIPEEGVCRQVESCRWSELVEAGLIEDGRCSGREL